MYEYFLTAHGIMAEWWLVADQNPDYLKYSYIFLAGEKNPLISIPLGPGVNDVHFLCTNPGNFCKMN